MVQSPKHNIHGVVLLDKPGGMSSNHALQKIKHHLNAKKAGHTGALDPLATGLLPICLGQATKVSEYLLGSDKRYTTVIKLGEITDTLDAEGLVLETRPVKVQDSEIASALDQFRGEIKQVPPMYSALKRHGQPLYKLARQGVQVERKARSMTVFELTAKRLSEFTLQLDVHCSSGFYIRSLAHDLGQLLGCGAHVLELRRTSIKSIGVAQAITLEQALNANPETLLQSIDVLIENLPQIILNADQTEHLSHGRSAFSGGELIEQRSRFYTPCGQLFGIGCVNADGAIKLEKRFVF